VRESVTVNATPQQAFEVFTADHGSWWPRTHHIGKTPMVEGHIECRPGGRCYSVHEDGTECDWGKILVWEPPHRLVIAWQITHQWGYNPNPAEASEVEVRFISLGEHATRVDLEHRFFERMGPGGQEMRNAVDAGWPKLLDMFVSRCSALVRESDAR
jgi:uncharacterized protein YndB with AHSA1/START domain